MTDATWTQATSDAPPNSGFYMVESRFGGGGDPRQVDRAVMRVIRVYPSAPAMIRTTDDMGGTDWATDATIANGQFWYWLEPIEWPGEVDLAALRTKPTEAKEWVHLGGQEMLLEVGKIIGSLTPMSQKETIMEMVKQLGRLRDPDVMVHECGLDDMGPDGE